MTVISKTVGSYSGREVKIINCIAEEKKIVKPLSLSQRLVKRIFDLVLSVMGLIVLFPVMVITALCIKLSDRGPAIYKQKRLTENGRVFEVYKFRSMKTDAEADGVARLCKYDDSRVTPIGKILRKYHIDELPQLINIIKGDMSVVGPRPERPELAEEILKKVPDFNDRLAVKAGLTGYAQVEGEYSTKPKEKLKMDMYYINNYSLKLDIKIFFKTLKLLIK